MKYDVLDRAILDAITSTPGIKFDRLHRLIPVEQSSQALADSAPKDRRGHPPEVWRIVDRRLQALRKKSLIVAKNGWHPVFEKIGSSELMVEPKP